MPQQHPAPPAAADIPQARSAGARAGADRGTESEGGGTNTNGRRVDDSGDSGGLNGGICTVGGDGGHGGGGGSHQQWTGGGGGAGMLEAPQKMIEEATGSQWRSAFTITKQG